MSRLTVPLMVRLTNRIGGEVEELEWDAARRQWATPADDA